VGKIACAAAPAVDGGRCVCLWQVVEGSTLRKGESMKTVLLAAFAVILTVSASAQPTNKAQKECAVAAFTEYNRANLALLTQANPVLSIEATIAQRRLEEQYCIRFSQCIIGNQGNVPFLVTFSKCLEDEALEKYNAATK
jgi:hypothetical protein